MTMAMVYKDQIEEGGLGSYTLFLFLTVSAAAIWPIDGALDSVHTNWMFVFFLRFFSSFFFSCGAYGCICFLYTMDE